MEGSSREMPECCIIWIDILGFENRCEQVAKRSGGEPDQIRASVQAEFEEKTLEYLRSPTHIAYRAVGGDSWVHFIRSADEALQNTIAFQKEIVKDIFPVRIGIVWGRPRPTKGGASDKASADAYTLVEKTKIAKAGDIILTEAVYNKLTNDDLVHSCQKITDVTQDITSRFGALYFVEYRDLPSLQRLLRPTFEDRWLERPERIVFGGATHFDILVGPRSSTANWFSDDNPDDLTLVRGAPWKGRAKIHIRSDFYEFERIEDATEGLRGFSDSRIYFGGEIFVRVAPKTPNPSDFSYLFREARGQNLVCLEYILRNVARVMFWASDILAQKSVTDSCISRIELRGTEGKDLVFGPDQSQDYHHPFPDTRLEPYNLELPISNQVELAEQLVKLCRHICRHAGMPTAEKAGPTFITEINARRHVAQIIRGYFRRYPDGVSPSNELVQWLDRVASNR